MSRKKDKKTLNQDDTETCLAILAEIPQQKAIKVFVEDKMNRTAAEDFLKKVDKSCRKDSALAKIRKDEGDDKLKKNQYSDSLRLYTESIFLAKKDDECLPLAYANRSFVLFKMNYLKESLVDIEMALKCGYPKSNLKKLLLRKKKCLLALEEVEKAKKALTKTSRDSQKEMAEFIANEFLEFKGVINKSVSNPEENLPKLTGGENENFVYASNYVSVHYNEAKGRHVVANEDIKPGDVLFVEKPFSCVMRKNGWCHNCFKKTVAPIPCWDCLDVSYCSPKCKQEFTKSIHSFECGYGSLLKLLGITHQSLRILLSASSSLDELKQILKKLSSPEIKNGIVLWKDGYNRVYNLVHHSDQHDELDSVFYAKASLILATYLKNYTNYFPATGNDKDLLIVTSVIWLHIFQSVCNGFVISKILAFEKTATDVQDLEFGSGIYPSVSMMNHSCHAPTLISYVGKWMVVRATRRIEKGSEVFCCYGPESTRMDRANRREKLSRQYFFHCECSHCLLNVDVHDIFTAFKCTNCQGPSVMDEENSGKVVCVNCGSTQESTELLQKKDKFYTLIQDENENENENVLIRLKRFLAGWKLGREILYKFHKDLGRVADQLSHILMMIGKCKLAIMFLKCSIRSVEVRFGPDSIELANELLKLGSVYSISVHTSEDIEIRKLVAEDVFWHSKAYAIMTTLCSPDYEGLKEIQKYKILLMRSTYK